MRFFCGFPPGGTADLLCRLLADAVTSEIGQNMIVETKTGASGFIANEAFANAAARRPHHRPRRDGGDVRVAGDARPEAADQRRHRPDADRQRRRRLQHAGVRQARALPHRARDDRLAKKNPGKLTYASAGNGTSQHLAGELFKKLAGVDLLHVPYRGGAPAIQDMVPATCDLMFGNMPEFLGQIGGGGLIPIAFGAPRPRRCSPTCR